MTFDLWGHPPRQFIKSPYLLSLFCPLHTPPQGLAHSWCLRLSHALELQFPHLYNEIILPRKSQGNDGCLQ